MKTLGIIGGLGPMASAYLLRLIIEMTDAKTDQEHLDVILFDRPQVPDRTAYILDRTKPSPLPSMRDTAQTLERLGAGVICAPCVTSHYFYKELQESVSVPFLHMVEETGRELLSMGRKTVGILATTGTVSSGLFQTAFEKLGLTALVPSEQGQALVMAMIYEEIKAGKAVDPEKLRAVSQELFGRGCDSLVLGCTELSLIKRDLPLGHGYLDALEVLSKRCVEACGAPLKPAYRQLLT